MLIGGAGLALAYLNDPEQTGSKFVPNPFGEEPGARLYRTGDVARQERNGTIEFLGRLDQQVKVRGYRVELGEIEAALAARDDVRESAVVALRDLAGWTRLVAHVVPKENAELTIRHLRTYLAQKLPDYMIPSVIRIVERLPLTASGKVDRRALSGSDGPTPIPEELLFEPRSEIEEVIAGIWAQALELDSIAVGDSFFELGGHSLLATRVMSQLRQCFNVEVPLRTIFDYPTVRTLAAEVQKCIRSGRGLELPPIERAPRDRPLPLSFSQQRLWFLQQLDPESPAYNVPIALRLTGFLNLNSMEQTLSEITRRHEILRTRIVTADLVTEQVIDPQELKRLRIVDLSELGGEARAVETRCLSKEEARRPFKLSQAESMRVCLFRLAEQEQVIAVNMHHIVSDDRSIENLVREVGSLYQRFSAGQPSSLPELEIQHADYAVWQRRYMAGDVLERHLRYWQDRLQQAPRDTGLPIERIEASHRSRIRGRAAIRLEKSTVLEMRKVGNRCGCTSFMVLLASFNGLLFRYTGRTDIVIGTAIENRTMPETEALIGCFVNTLVLRTEFSSTSTFEELLGRVRQVALGAYAHQDLPFETLVRELAPSRSLGENPLFQIMFLFRKTGVRPLELPGLSLESSETDNDRVKFSLILNLQETTEGIEGWVGYDTGQFDAPGVNRLTKHFQTILKAAVSNCEHAVASLSLMTTTERHQLLIEWNDSCDGLLKGASISRMFEAQVDRTPGAIALVSKGLELTYRDLNQ